jgi:indolepyruvate ferredoxin oxidoreductase
MDAVLGMAAHLCGLHASGLSLTGLSQKGGAVECHVRISNERIHSTRIPPGTVDTMIAFDLVTATSPESLAMLKRDRSHVVVNLQETPTADFIHDPQKVFPKDKMLSALIEAVGADHVHGIEAGSYATELFGDSIAANMFLVGYAYQLGLVPIKVDAIREAIRLNGVSVSMNLDAFACGRYAAAFPAEFESVGWEWREEQERNRLPDSRDERIAFFTQELVAYQGKRYAERYLALVTDAMALDRKMGNADTMPLTDAVIKYFYKLLAYKDEYEVARLYTDGEFERQLKRVFGEDHGAVSHSLAPPSLGTKKKMFGPWMFTAMRVMARFKFLRGTWLDPFGYSAHRKEERELITRYESLIAEMAYGLNADNYDLAVALLSIPEEIRGYGHVKQASIEKAKKKAEGLLRIFRDKVKMT